MARSTYHHLMVDWPLGDGNHLEHDGSLRSGLLRGIRKQLMGAAPPMSRNHSDGSYHQVDDLLRLHPPYREAVHLHDSVPGVEQTYDRRSSWLQQQTQEESREQLESWLTAALRQAAVDHPGDEDLPAHLLSLYCCSLNRR